MKNNIFLAALLLLAACTKLKDTSYNQIIGSQFNPTASDLQSLAGAAYVNWRYVLQDWNGMFRAEEVTGDEVVIPARPNGWVDGGIYVRMSGHSWTADDDIVVNTWTRAYAGITNCNRVIYQIASGLVPVTTGKENILAELKVLRASYYYVLCDFYGNVPIVTQFDVPDGYLPVQNTRKEVYDFIIKDIQDNLSLLSDKNDQTTYGKFNQWAAHALLAKMYLNAEVYAGVPDWQNCIKECDAIINSGAGFMLEAVQKHVFITETADSREITFALPYDEPYVTNWNAFDIHM